MKHQVGDLIALCDISNWMNPVYHLGYIESIRDEDNYYIYFFYNEKVVWYPKDSVDSFKKNLEELNRFEGKRENDWKPGTIPKKPKRFRKIQKTIS